MDRASLRKPLTDKYKAAMNSKKPCLTPAWIDDSLKAGYTLPMTEPYLLESSSSTKTFAVSTPTKRKASETMFDANCTTLSSINGCSNDINQTINESVMPSHSVTLKAAGPSKKSYQNVLANITVTKAQQAGPFLDGCKVSVSFHYFVSIYISFYVYCTTLNVSNFISRFDRWGNGVWGKLNRNILKILHILQALQLLIKISAI